MIHVHDYRDVRYIHQLVFNWSVAPFWDTDPNSSKNDGSPKRHMQLGQTYRCLICLNHISPGVFYDIHH